MNVHLQRAYVLLAQQRADLAEAELRRALADDPNDGPAHALLADCLGRRDQLDEATAEARQAIFHAPDLPAGHAAMARALCRRNRLPEARRAIAEAVRLDPYDADHFGLWAGIEYSERDWPASLQAAEAGLQIDPEHVTCNNFRAMALTQLGRRDEASATIRDVLRLDPENAFSHANQGWALLHARDPKKAKEHFAEALRLEPGMEFARQGLIEAMKAHNPIYALLLRYFLWMNRLSRQAQWGLILGGLIGQSVLREAGRQNPALAPFVMPILIVYVVFVLMTWLATPLFNLLLMLDRFGRHALSRIEKIEAGIVGALVGLALVSLAAWGALILANSDWLWLALAAAIYFGLLTLTSSGIFKVPTGWPRGVMIAYASGLAIVGLAMFLTLMIDVKSAGPMVMIFGWGCALSWIPINALQMVRVRR